MFLRGALRGACRARLHTAGPAEPLTVASAKAALRRAPDTAAVRALERLAAEQGLSQALGPLVHRALFARAQSAGEVAALLAETGRAEPAARAYARLGESTAAAALAKRAPEARRWAAEALLAEQPVDGLTAARRLPVYDAEAVAKHLARRGAPDATEAFLELADDARARTRVLRGLSPSQTTALLGPVAELTAEDAAVLALAAVQEGDARQAARAVQRLRRAPAFRTPPELSLRQEPRLVDELQRLTLELLRRRWPGWKPLALRTADALLAAGRAADALAFATRRAPAYARRAPEMQRRALRAAMALGDEARLAQLVDAYDGPPAPILVRALLRLGDRDRARELHVPGTPDLDAELLGTEVADDDVQTLARLQPPQAARLARALLRQPLLDPRAAAFALRQLPRLADVAAYARAGPPATPQPRTPAPKNLAYVAADLLRARQGPAAEALLAAGMAPDAPEAWMPVREPHVAVLALRAARRSHPEAAAQAHAVMRHALANAPSWAHAQWLGDVWRRRLERAGVPPMPPHTAQLYARARGRAGSVGAAGLLVAAVRGGARLELAAVHDVCSVERGEDWRQLVALGQLAPPEMREPVVAALQRGGQAEAALSLAGPVSAAGARAALDLGDLERAAELAPTVELAYEALVRRGEPEAALQRWYAAGWQSAETLLRVMRLSAPSVALTLASDYSESLDSAGGAAAMAVRRLMPLLAAEVGRPRGEVQRLALEYVGRWSSGSGSGLSLSDAEREEHEAAVGLLRRP